MSKKGSRGAPVRVTYGKYGFASGYTTKQKIVVRHGKPLTKKQTAVLAKAHRQYSTAKGKGGLIKLYKGRSQMKQARSQLKSVGLRMGRVNVANVHRTRSHRTRRNYKGGRDEEYQRTCQAVRS